MQNPVVPGKWPDYSCRKLDAQFTVSRKAEPLICSLGESARNSFLFDSPPPFSKDGVTYCGDGNIPITGKTRHLAEQLVLRTNAGRANVPAPANAAFSGFTNLLRPLISITGVAASMTLGLRALTLAKADLPRLAGLTLGATGLLQGLTGIHPPLTREELDEGEIVLIGYTVELLSTFVGEALALRLIQDQCPGASFVDQELENEGNP